jgi:alpha-1,6-mannosyltransferase
MLTILEVDDFWSRPDEGMRRHANEKLRLLEARDDLRYVFVRADDKRYAEARGTQVVVEHVVAPKLPGSERPAVLLRPLTELIQLHRPGAIVCRTAIVMLLAVGLASFRLSPRPALIGRWREVGAAERTAWKLTRRVRGFDAVFVSSQAEADAALELGLDRLWIAPIDDIPGEVARIREIVELRRAGRRVPTGVHDVVP